MSEKATEMGWCENGEHGTRLHGLSEDCLYPHAIGPAGDEPVVGHPYTVHD